ncbi:MAG TPA: N-acetylmuramoyl-L-alanine amidase [Candidatus Limnocylindria bacterium]|nr:N-acetylmuramoyl-L-alanine amidase [Candidatus Limnocylindria bacterium]
MTRPRSTPVWPILVLMACLGGAVGAAQAARPESVEVRDHGGSRGFLTITVVDDGSAYIAPDHLAALLGGAWAVKGDRGTLTVGKRVAEFTRGQPRATVHGQAVALAVAPRVNGRAWLVSRDFLGKGLPRLAPGVSIAAVTEPRKPATRTAQGAVPLEELRYRSYPTFTRVVIETGARLAYAVVTGDEEVRVRLPGLALGRSRVEEIGDGLVQEVRLEPVGDSAVLRVVLQGTAGEVKHTVLQDPYRLVLDVYRPKEGGGPGAAGRGVMEPLRLIVLDAGHGGHDLGAVGPNGVQEKDVVLDVTRRVAKKVEAGLGVKVVMSRDSDVFVPLRDRTNFANKQRADLFVSIHANAHPRSVSEGVETYFLSSEASDSAARQVAAIENGVVQLEGPGSRQRVNVLKSILWDLAQSEFQAESSVMAETVLDSMSKSLNLVNRGVKQAGFYVLGGAAMPAILIEIGFLTNRREERKLATPEHREAIARAIYEGLAEYKRRYDQRLRTAQSQPAKGAPTR